MITHWVCAKQGWLYTGLTDDIRYKDYAGSSVVHMVGGVLALVGAYIVGPRIGRFDGNSRHIHGHTVPVGRLIHILSAYILNGFLWNYITRNS